MNKTPEVIDAELELAFSERRSILLSIAGLSLLLLVMLVTLVILIRATTTQFPKREFVYTTNAAAVCAFTPLDQQGDVTDANIRNFATQIAIDLHALDFVNFRSTLDRVTAINFTAEARVAAAEALRDSGILRTVTQQFFILRAVQRDTAVIVQQGVVNDRYQWRVRVPVTLAYTSRGREGAPNYRPEERDIILTIVRTEQTAANPLGLVVSGLLSTQPASGLEAN